MNRTHFFASTIEILTRPEQDYVLWRCTIKLDFACSRTPSHPTPITVALRAPLSRLAGGTTTHFLPRSVAINGCSCLTHLLFTLALSGIWSSCPDSGPQPTPLQIISQASPWSLKHQPFSSWEEKRLSRLLNPSKWLQWSSPKCLLQSICPTISFRS